MNLANLRENILALRKNNISLANASSHFGAFLWRYRHSSILFAFGILTILMTYPTLLYLNSAVRDYGDSLLNTWIIAQNAHHILIGEPFQLFEGNIFYPYHHTLAFSEHLLGLIRLIHPQPPLKVTKSSLVFIPYLMPKGWL